MARKAREAMTVGEAGSAAAEWFPVSELVPWARNPKAEPDDVRPWVESIRAFGFGEPILARKADRMVIAGHARLEAAKELGMATVPVRFLDISRRQAEKLAITITQLERLRKWNYGLLSGLLNEFRDDDEDLGVLGFSENELARALGESYESIVHEVDVSEARAEFFITVTGPLPAEPEVLEALKEALGKIDGVEAHIVTSEL